MDSVDIRAEENMWRIVTLWNMKFMMAGSNALTIGWQNLNPLSHPNAILAPNARASGEDLNYMTLAPQARPSGEILNYLLSHLSDILERSLALIHLNCR